jgi:transglutaminase-like putative cysteine protease
MTQQRHITLVAAGATVLAALPLAAVFEKWTWLVSVLIVVGAMTGAAVGLRSVRAPAWAPTLGMIGAYVLTLTVLFGRGNALLGIIPSPATISYFNELLAEAGVAIRDSGVPVGDEDGLLFLAALGIGSVHLAIDLAAVVARRPAIAGIPMVAIYLVPVGTHSDSVSFLPFVCTAAAFLWLLATDNVDRVRRFGRRFTGDGRDVDVWEPSPLAAAGRRLAVVGVAVAVVLPLAVPGMTTGLLDRFGSGMGNGPGTGNGPGRAGTVNLFSFLSGSLVRDRTYDMVKVTTNDPAPFYVRFGVADELNSNGFVNRPWSQGQQLGNLAAPTVGNGPGVSVRNFTASFEIVNFNEQILPLFQYPTKADKLDSAWLWDRRAGVIYSNRANAKGRKYTISFARFEFTPEALRGAPDLANDDAVRQQYTRMPEVPRVRQKAQELVKGKTTQYDKVRAIYDFFSPTNNFRYNLTTQSGNSGSIMVDFLERKEGYCEQFAAAMAWLVRAAGIPARVAFGFTRGTNRNGNTYTLNNFNLHAWTEVYFDGFGWVPFDATPASSISGSVPTSWAPDPTQPTGSSFPDSPDDLSASGNPSTGASAPGTDPFGPNDPGSPTGDGGAGGMPHWSLYALGGALVMLLLLAMPGLRRATLRRRRWPGLGGYGPPMAVAGDGPGDGGGRSAPSPTHERARRDAHAAWDELVDTMVDFRVAVDPAETPRVMAGRLIREQSLKVAAEAGARSLGRAEERARYARDPLTDVDLATSLRDVRTALRERVSTRTRLIATFLPPSVLNRWRAATTSWYTTTVTRVGARRDALVRVTSPRRLLAGRSGR